MVQQATRDSAVRSSTHVGRYALIEQFLTDGISVMFGNPGTVEQGFLDAVSDFPAMRYIETLQESVAVGMADGYARSTKRPALVQLHSGVGLGNGIGMMYQAMRGHAPLVVIAGEAGTQYEAMDAQMAADLVGMARPVTKWATRVVHPTSLLRVIRRAIKTAATPPTGPVFVALPMDVLDALNDEPIVPTSVPSTRVGPDQSVIADMARRLLAAQRPLIIQGDGIAASGAGAELTSVAELLGAEVWGADSSEVNMSQNHPLFRDLLGHMFGEHSQAIAFQADAVLIVGTYVFPEVFPALEGVFAAGAPVIHIDLNAYEIAKNFPVDIGIVADPKVTLGTLARALGSAQTSAQRDAAQARLETFRAQKEQERNRQLEADARLREAVPMHAARFMEELAARLPDDAIIFDEALTTSPEVTRYLPPSRPGHYFQTRGGSLGVGIPGAIGIKVAEPDKTVIGFTGDGGAMYTIQALWTAAHHDIAAKFVICNNHSYKLLKANIQQYWRERTIPEREFPACFDITNPDIQFTDLARSVGVEAARVETPDQIGPTIGRMLSHEGPFLIDLILSPEVPGHPINITCGQ